MAGYPIVYMEELFAVYPGNPYPFSLCCRCLQVGEFLVSHPKKVATFARLGYCVQEYGYAGARNRN